MYKFLQKIGTPPRACRKLWLTMKLTTLLLIVGILQVSATSLAQKVVLNEKNAPLAEVFENIRQQTGYDFVFTKSILNQAKPINLQFSGELGDALKKIFDNEPFDYQVSDKSVLIKTRANAEPRLLDKITQAIAAIDVTGRVIDEHNQPISGATVRIKDGNNATTTDANGFYRLKDVQLGTKIVITFIGYDPVEFEATTANNFVNVLQVATSKLDEVQVQAYGVTSKRLSTGDIATVRAETIEKQPVSNPLLALQGQVSGLIVNQSNGLNGSGVTVEIRGQNYIPGGTKTSNVFYVVDGVPYPAEMLSLGTGGMLGLSGQTYLAYGSPFSFINPDDIESISVLKDAAATSIYGSQAANGAILITTKKGKVGDAKINVKLQNGIGSLNHFLSLMNTSEFLQMRRDAFINGGSTPGPYDADLNGDWDTTQNHNWQKELLGRTSHYTDYNASISGGSVGIQYMISSTFHKETTVFPGSDADSKAAVHFNLSSASNNRRFHISLTGNYLHDNNQLPSIDLTNPALTLAPLAPNLFKPDGTINWGNNTSGISTFWNNPMSYFLQPFIRKTNNLIANANLSYNIIPNLIFSTSLGYNDLSSEDSQIYPLSSVSDDNKPYAVRSAQFGNQNNHSWIIEPQLHYAINTGKGHIDAIIGSTMNQQFSGGTNILVYGQPSDQVLYNLTASATNVTISVPQAVYKYVAIFSRINYNWEDKYLFDLSARRDGSSRFGPSRQFANFWSLGAGWIFSEENIVKENAKWLSFGKIKGSYGTTGTDQIGDYQFMDLYSFQNYPNNYQGVTNVIGSGLINPFLQFALTKKFEVSATFGFVKNRINIDGTFFHNVSSNQLAAFRLPAITGFNSVVENEPIKTQEQGWEFLLNTVNVKTKDFNWNTSFNISFIKNRLIANMGPPNRLLTEGYPFTGTFLTYHFLGVDPSSGLYQFADGKGGITTTPEKNPIQTQNTRVDFNPKFYGGFQNSFTYKNISLDLIFQFVKKRGANYKFGAGPLGLSDNTNQPAWLANHWTNPGNNALYAKATTDFSAVDNYNDAINSDAGSSDASYIRLKNLSLSFKLPTAWTNRIQFESAKIFVNAQNLFTVTNYMGLDPETGNLGLPPLRIISFGFQIGL